MPFPRDPATAGVRFLHTADLQLGKPFLSIPGDAGAKLRERRLDAIDTLSEVARANEADMVLVAGDFFDANAASDRLVQQVLSRVRRAKVLFVVLPGNHDHAGTGSIYARQSFRKDCPENLVVLDRREPCVLSGGRAVILPAPLYRQQELGDPTAHMTHDFGASEAPGAIRIGLAHGSVLDVARDADGRAPNLIPMDRADRAALDYLALGDWHGMKQISERAWYSGTPEPDRYRQNDPGFALLVDIAASGAALTVRPIPVASTRWIVREDVVSSAADLQRLQAWFDALEAPEDTLVQLTVTGALPCAEMNQLRELLDGMGHRLLHLKPVTRIRESLSDADLAGIAVDGAVRNSIDKLRALATSSEPRARVADRALLTLHRLAFAAGDASC